MLRPTRDWAIAIVLFALALWQNVAYVPTTDFHRDEARWIHRARFIEQALHPLSAYWMDQDLTQGQPPFGSYVTGLGLLLQGHNVETGDFWSFHFSEAWNVRHGRMPSPEDHTAARQTNAVIGALIVVGVYFIGQQLRNRVSGVIGALLLIPHPLSIYLASLAGSDALLGLLVVWATLAAIALAKHPTWWRATLLGVLLGLGGATKLSPLLIAQPLAMLGVALLWGATRTSGAEARRLAAVGWRLIPLPAIAFATFVAIYPYLWPAPIDRSLTLFAYRSQEMESQSQIWSALDVPTPGAALGRIGYWLGDRDATSTEVAAAVASWLGVAWEPGGIDLLFALAGALILLYLVIKHGLGSPWALAAAVLGAQVAAVVLGMRADFARYLLPVLIVAAICGGLFAGQVWETVHAWATARRGVSGPASAPALASELPPRTLRA
ncbi:MAG: phospholipid carrier-dependent glycosyltransferase [Chloroflexota bacterium]|nr:phospholipid carrier-dependent glycosyltransferase [Chloroflexota bacterium]